MISKNFQTCNMESKYEVSAEIKNMFDAPVNYNTTTRMHTKFDTRNNSFLLSDSVEAEPTLLISRMKIDDAAILFVDKGEVTLKHNLKTCTISQGMLLLKVPKVNVRLVTVSEDCHFKIFGFPPEFAIAAGMPAKHLELLALTTSTNPVFALDTLKAATIDVLFSLLQKKENGSETQEFHNETIKHLFSLLILELVSLIRKNLTGSTFGLTRKSHLTFQFLKSLGEHIKEQRSVNFYAQLLYVTPKHLSMCVKETTGKTCGEIIDEMVVAEAKTLLHDTELTIGRVANVLNFSDQYFFSKYFKKRTGMSPLNYRLAV